MTANTVETTRTTKATTSSSVVLVDFWAPWCGPCLMQKPTVEKLADDYAGRATIEFCNVDENPARAQQYGVVSIPTLLLTKDGEEIARFVGVQSEQTLRDALEKALQA